MEPGELLAHREALFTRFLQDIPDALEDLRQLAKTKDESLVAVLERLDSGLSMTDFSQWSKSDRDWLVSRLGTLLGEIEIRMRAVLGIYPVAPMNPISRSLW